MNRIHRTLMLLAAAVLFSASAFSTPLSEMSAEDIRTMLAMRPEKGYNTGSVTVPVEVTAVDMITKVYGVLDPACSKSECIAGAQSAFSMTPQEDLGALWLETADGFGVNYSGMQPEVAAMARYGTEDIAGDPETGKLSDFGFFFIFPYADGGRDASTRNQAAFCGSLLQELHDMGVSLGQNTATDDLFEAVGDYAGNLVDIRLIEDPDYVDGGRYVLVLSIEPGAYTPADNALAEL